MRCTVPIIKNESNHEFKGAHKKTNGDAIWPPPCYTFKNELIFFNLVSLSTFLLSRKKLNQISSCTILNPSVQF